MCCRRFVWHLSRRYGPRTSFSARLASRAKANAGGSQTLFADQVGICSDQVTDRTGGEQRRAPDELFNDGLKRSLPMRSRARDQARLGAETRSILE